MSHADPSFQVWGMVPLVAFMGSGLILANHVSPVGLAGRSLRSNFLQFFGRYSYGLYVWHGLLIFHFDRWFPFRTYLGLTGGRFSAAVLIHAVLATATSVAISVISRRFFEEKFLGLKRFFDDRPSKEESSTILSEETRNTMSSIPS